ncbi:MAG: formate dehydrogenase accessory sulfurtransferase FdhD [Thiohalomonadaceae bacterium]
MHPEAVKEYSLDGPMSPVCARREDEAEPFGAAAWPTSAPITVTRIEGGARADCVDHVVEEVPVALVYNGISHAVMLASPEKLEELALGFSLSEGILAHPAELYDLEIRAGEQGIEVHMEIASRRFMALKERRRSLAGRTGCGLCGVDSLSAVARTCAPVVRGAPVSLAAISAALAALPSLQPLRAATGAVHAAAWADAAGRIEFLCEDVGRHNALDKLIGALARGGIVLQDGFLLVSSRASYEMVQKAAGVGIGYMVAVSAPTALAVRLAHSAGLTLAGFAREGRLVVYSHGEFIVPCAPASF